MNIQLPEAVQSSYRIHNGQVEHSSGLLDNEEFLSLERIKDEWTIWKELLESGTFNDENGEDFGCEPDSGIRNIWWSDK